MKKLLILIVLFLVYGKCMGDHLIGGSLGYERLGGDTFLIRLQLFKDCLSGADFDNPVVLGIFDSQGDLVFAPSIPYTFETLLPQGENLCAPLSIYKCTSSANYEQKVVLPQLPGGYTIVYQRCCWDESLVSVTNDQGLTLETKISETDHSLNNSSPHFTNFSYKVICINQPYVFDGSAIDPDGDDLKYDFSVGMIGGSVYMPMPQPPMPPPYDSLTFAAGYAFSEPFGFSSIQIIDSLTGQLHVTPSQAGSFIICITAHEYRDSIWLGDHQRLFEITVGEFAVGIYDPALNLADIYPNPATSELNVILPTGQNADQIIIYTTSGEVVRLIDPVSTANKTDIDITSLNPGFYLLSVLTSGSVFHSRFVKN